MKKKCCNLSISLDSNGNEVYNCRSTHVCYKRYCLVGDLFHPFVKLYHGYIDTEDNLKKKFKDYGIN